MVSSPPVRRCAAAEVVLLAHSPFVTYGGAAISRTCAYSGRLVVAFPHKTDRRWTKPATGPPSISITLHVLAHSNATVLCVAAHGNMIGCRPWRRDVGLVADTRYWHISCLMARPATRVALFSRVVVQRRWSRRDGRSRTAACPGGMSVAGADRGGPTTLRAQLRSTNGVGAGRRNGEQRRFPSTSVRHHRSPRGAFSRQRAVPPVGRARNEDQDGAGE
jgi:hypothetical protein